MKLYYECRRNDEVTGISLGAILFINEKVDKSLVTCATITILYWGLSLGVKYAKLLDVREGIEVESFVRMNLLTSEGYTPYCGAERCRHSWPRTVFVNGQFHCSCKWKSSFDRAFIQRYEKAQKELGDIRRYDA